MKCWDVVVVGAGPAGAATASLLADAGVDVLLLDRARFPRDKPCSEYLGPESTRILGRLPGCVLTRVEGAGPARLYGMKLVAPSGRATVGRFAAGHPYLSPRPYSFALPRTVFDQILRDAAERAGAVVLEDVKAEDLVRKAGGPGGRGGPVEGVVARSARGAREVHRARVVVGADGLRSVVARRLRLRRAAGPRRIAFCAHLARVAGVADIGEMHVGRCGYVGLGPIGRGLTTVALVMPAWRAARNPPTTPRRFLAELEAFPGLRGRFDRSEVVREVLVTGPFAQWSRPPIADGTLLVGDAADFFDPFTGQGIYRALRGAELAAEALVPLLARGTPLSATALGPYARARHRAFAGNWTLERLIALGVGWPALAERVVGRLARRPALADLLVGATGNFVPARAVLAPQTLGRLVW